jgi:1-acyl-sn-glycerol-3-phosphate acyltransferase
VVEPEKIPPIEGKTLLIFNHRSYLDFALNFFALGTVRKSNGRFLRPRFIAAKDHFIDNPFLYSWIGLGKVIENAGMIFIERKKKGRGWIAMREAAQKLETNDVEIAVYPQGTRAYPFQAYDGTRQDAGYYTTFNRKTWDKPTGHLKPGTPFLIMESLIHLRKMGIDKLNVLLTGIKGTGVAGPKGSFLIQTETDIEFHIEPLWEIPTSYAEGVQCPEDHEASTPEEKRYVQKLEELTEEINRRLLKAIDYHRILRERVKEEFARLKVPTEEINAMERRLINADHAEDLRPYVLIDRILSLKPVYWDRFLHLLLSIKDQPEKGESWNALLQEVSEKVKHREAPVA